MTFSTTIVVLAGVLVLHAACVLGTSQLGDGGSDDTGDDETGPSSDAGASVSASGSPSSPTNSTDSDGSHTAESTGAPDCPSPIVLTQDVAVLDVADLAALECVTRIDGGLTIGPSDTIVDLLPLAHLVEVTGPLSIVDNTALETLDGLDALAISHDEMFVSRNAVLQDTRGLRGLEHVHTLWITDNPALTDLTAFTSTVEVGERGLDGYDLVFGENPLVTDFDGFAHVSQLTLVGGFLRVSAYEQALVDDVSGLAGLLPPAAILELSGLPVLEEMRLEGVAELAVLRLARMPALTSLAGLADLTRLGSLHVEGPHALESLTGLDNLTHVESLLAIGVCHDDIGDLAASSLLDLTGLGGLVEVARVQINGQPSLVSIAGLPETLVVEELVFRNNPLLPEAEVLDYSDTVMPASVIEVCGNQDGAPCGDPNCPNID